MYSKIYKEIFINDYALKKRLKDNIWIIRIGNHNYYLFIYEDVELVDGFKNYNEAELLQYSSRFLEDTDENLYSRISENRKFFEEIKRVKKENSYLFRNYGKNKNKNMNDDEVCQKSLFSFDNFRL